MTSIRGILKVFVAATLVVCSATKAEQTSGKLILTSDYLFRGIDRTDGPALEGEVDTFGDNGLYAGGWISNNRAAGGGEFDAYGGWSGAFNFLDIYPLRIDCGAIGYLFPGDEEQRDSTRRNTDFAEGYAGLRFGPLGLKLYGSPNYQNAGAPGGSLRGTLRYPLSRALTAGLEGGFDIGPGVRDYTERLTKNGMGRDYFDYVASLEYDLPQDFLISAQVSGTTLDIADGRGRGGSQPKVLVSVSRRFDF